MPPAPGRPHPVDLLLCGHHYQAGRAALHTAGATVYDEAGVPIMAGGSEQPPTASPPQRPAADPARYARFRSRPARTHVPARPPRRLSITFRNLL